MKLTIVRDDNAVGVDGRWMTVDCSSLPDEVRAVQWNGTTGHIEYDASPPKAPKAITSIDAYASIIAAWTTAKNAADAPRAPRAATADDVARERNRRLALGFDYDFGGQRGVHHIGTTDADMRGWSEVSTYAGALIDSGDTETTIAIATDTGLTQVTAPEWRAIEIAAAAFRQPLWAASFALMAQSPIPQDYTDDSHWT